MALERRTAGDSYIFIGRQSQRGEFITGLTVFQGDAPDWSDLNAIDPALTKRIFPFVRNTLDPTSETTESESIVGGNAAIQDIITKRSGAGEWEFEVLPEDVIHLLLGWFNPDSLPTNTAVISRGTDGAIPAAKITLAAAVNGKQTVSIDNTGTSPPIADKWPGQLNIKFPSSGALDGTGTITIYGEQRRSRSNNFNAQAIETLTATAAELESSDGVSSKKFYRKAQRIILSGFTTPATTTEKPVLAFKANTQTTSLTLNSLNALFAGWTTQMAKATTPFIGYNVVPNGFRIAVSGTSIRLILELIASYVQEGRVLLKPLEVAYKLPKFDRPQTDGTELADYEQTAASQTDQNLVLENYQYKNLDFYPANGTAVALGEPGQSLADLITAVENNTATLIPITNIETRATHNYDEPDGFTGDPVSGDPITGEGQTREVAVSATIVHQTDTDYSNDNDTVFWQDRYFEGQEIPIIIRNYNWSPNGRQNLIETRFPKCRLTEVPNLPIDGQGQANRTLAFGAFPTASGGNPDQIQMHFYSEGGFKED